MRQQLLKGFTLAEVLITLLIIGVVAAIVVPNVIQDTQNQEYITGYKKAYADASLALKEMLADNDYMPRSDNHDYNATMNNWTKFKDKFQVQKDCSSDNRFDCWAQNGDCAQGYTDENGVYQDAQKCTLTYQPSFIDNSGRTWTTYNTIDNIILVDINGFKQPNRLGRDRWVFSFANSDNTKASIGTPTKVLSYSNDSGASRWCPLGSCMYSTWLFGTNGVVR